MGKLFTANDGYEVTKTSCTLTESTRVGRIPLGRCFGFGEGRGSLVPRLGHIFDCKAVLRVFLAVKKIGFSTTLHLGDKGSARLASVLPGVHKDHRLVTLLDALCNLLIDPNSLQQSYVSGGVNGLQPELGIRLELRIVNADNSKGIDSPEPDHETKRCVSHVIKNANKRLRQHCFAR